MRELFLGIVYAAVNAAEIGFTGVPIQAYGDVSEHYLGLSGPLVEKGRSAERRRSMPETTTTKADVEHLLEYFASYINPNQEFDPWFTLAEINQQFAWEDIPEDTLVGWLNEMSQEGKVEVRPGKTREETEWRWLS